MKTVIRRVHTPAVSRVGYWAILHARDDSSEPGMPCRAVLVSSYCLRDLAQVLGRSPQCRLSSRPNKDLRCQYRTIVPHDRLNPSAIVKGILPFWLRQPQITWMGLPTFSRHLNHIEPLERVKAEYHHRFAPRSSPQSGYIPSRVCSQLDAIRSATKMSWCHCLFTGL